jgi:hypothetical protein
VIGPEADNRVQAGQTNLQQIPQGDDAARRDAGTIAFRLVVQVASYAACVQSFELLNSEKKPFADYGLFGPYIRHLAPEATVADLLRRYHAEHLQPRNGSLGSDIMSRPWQNPSRWSRLGLPLSAKQIPQVVESFESGDESREALDTVALRVKHHIIFHFIDDTGSYLAERRPFMWSPWPRPPCQH